MGPLDPVSRKFSQHNRFTKSERSDDASGVGAGSEGSPGPVGPDHRLLRRGVLRDRPPQCGRGRCHPLDGPGAGRHGRRRAGDRRRARRRDTPARPAAGRCAPDLFDGSQHDDHVADVQYDEAAARRQHDERTAPPDDDDDHGAASVVVVRLRLGLDEEQARSELSHGGFHLLGSPFRWPGASPVSPRNDLRRRAASAWCTRA
jgi:hypothetical protein